jgi:hypothetical protein
LGSIAAVQSALRAVSPTAADPCRIESAVTFQRIVAGRSFSVPVDFHRVPLPKEGEIPMRNIVSASFVAATLATLCLCELAHAQTGPNGGSPTTPAGALSEQNLEAVIKALDPNFKVKPTSDCKGKIYELVVTREGWSYVLKVESFGNCVWLNLELSPVISSPQNIPAQVLAELLKLNFKHGPSHFTFTPMTDNSGVKLFLCHMLDRRMTSEEFNGYVTAVLNDVKATHPTWSQVR